MGYRFTYQLIRDGLDGKVGPDLRRVVEGYLGPDPDEQPRLHWRLCVEIDWAWAPGTRGPAWLSRDMKNDQVRRHRRLQGYVNEMLRRGIAEPRTIWDQMVGDRL